MRLSRRVLSRATLSRATLSRTARSAAVSGFGERNARRVVSPAMPARERTPSLTST